MARTGNGAESCGVGSQGSWLCPGLSGLCILLLKIRCVCLKGKRILCSTYCLGQIVPALLQVEGRQIGEEGAASLWDGKEIIENFI